jgi:transposase
MNLKNVAKRVSRKNSSSNVLDSKVVWDLVKTMTQAQIAKKFNVTVYAVRKALGLTNKKVVAV